MSCLSGRQHVYVHLFLKETKNELQKNKCLGLKNNNIRMRYHCFRYMNG